MGRIFNIAGPCNPEDHYMLPALGRLPDVTRLIDPNLAQPWDGRIYGRDIAWNGKTVHLVGI